MRAVRSLRAALPQGQTLPDEVWARRHRGILLLLWLHVPPLVGYAMLQGETLAHGLSEGLIVAIVAGVATVLRDHRRASTTVTAIGLLTCSAVLVHLSHGTIEMHFHYFVMVGVVTLYQDWRPFLAAIGYVVVQHGVAGALSPESVYNHQSAIDHPWHWAGVHGLFILGMSVAGIMSWRLNESLLEAATDREAKLAEAQQVAHLGSWEWDLRAGKVTWSRELYRLLGVDPARFDHSNDTFMALVHADDREMVRDAIHRTVTAGEPHVIDFRIVLPDGDVRWLNGRGEVTVWADGQPALLAGTAQDITERKRAEDELVDTLSLLGATLDATADGILVVDCEGGITSFNDRFREMWNLPADVLASGDDAAAMEAVLAQLVDPEGFVARVHDLYAHPEADSHDVIEFLDGRVFERSSKPQRVAGKTMGRVWSFSDLTERKRLEDQLSHQAFHDSLTNLANQALFRDRVGHAIARLERADGQIAVLFLDLDNFKTVNDSLGHLVGDQLLIAVTERITGCLRVADTAARLGGDEFAILLEDTEGPDDAIQVADRIIEAMRHPFEVAGQEVFASVSVGIAFDGDGTRPEQLLRNADLAMYTAKSRGKGRYEVFLPEMHAVAVERLEVEADLRRARQRGELRVFYQPIFDLASSTLRGVEALVRWQHPQRGLLSPEAFIPLAEETGLIHEIGREVLTVACRQARAWQLAFPSTPPLTMSVNLSPRQMAEPHLVDDVAHALKTSGLEPSTLVLEITEGAMMHDVEATIAMLRSLKALGVRIAVDDFGTGYSSLSYLEQFPVDVIKIDRSFVAGITDGPEESALARAIVRLAQTLELTAVAEGVETATQASRLNELGCDMAQGYLLGRPVNANDLEGWMRGVSKTVEFVDVVATVPIRQSSAA